MPLAPDDIPEGLLQELWRTYMAITRKVGNTDFTGIGHITSGIHKGKPNLDNLPGGDVNLWIHLRAVRRNEEQSTFTADAYDSLWDFTVVVRDDSQDEFGISPFQGLAVTAGINDNLRGELTDIDLDGAVSVQKLTDLEHDIGRSDGEPLDLWRVSMEALHKLTNPRAT